MISKINSISKYTIYDRILYLLLVNNIAQASSLLLVAKNKLTVYREIQKALTNKHIKEYKLRLRAPKRVKIVTYYGLTKLGIKYLRSREEVLPDEQKWVAFLPSEIESLDIFDTRIPRMIYRNLLLSSVNIAMSQAGLRCYPIFTVDNLSKHSDNGSASDQDRDVPETSVADMEYESFESDDFNDEENSKIGRNTLRLSRLVKESLLISKGIERNVDGAILNTDAEIIFYNSKEILKRIADKSSDEKKRISFGSQVGIAESPSKAVLVYAGSKSGMNWSTWKIDIDKDVFHAFNSISRYHKIDFAKTNAVMFVDSTKMLEDIFYDKASTKKLYEFGKGIDSLIFFPNTSDGMKNFTEYLLNDREKTIEGFKNAAIESGQYEERKGRFDNIFGLQDKDGVLTYVGIFMDGIQLRIFHEAIKELKKPYRIICYEWQEEFYKRVVPDASFVNVCERVEL